jgi:hypothetical protein
MTVGQPHTGLELGRPVSQSPTRWRGRNARGLAIALGIASATGLAVIGATQSSGPVWLPVGVALFAVVPIYMFFSSRVEISLAVLMCYLGVADGVVKLQTGSQFATMGRDVLLYAIALGLLVRMIVRRRPVRWPVLSGWVFGWCLVVLVQLLNPEDASWLHSVASLRQHLEFVPLFFIGSIVIDSRRRLRGFLTILLVLAGINGAVSLVQSAQTPDQLAKWGRGYADLINGTNGAPRLAVGADGKPRVRPPGLGGDMGFGGVLGWIAIPSGLALILLNGRRRGRAVLLGGFTLLASLGVISSQARSAVIAAFVVLLVFAGLVGLAGQAKRVVGAVALFAVVAVVAIGLVSSGSGTDPFYRYRSIAPNQFLQTTTESRSGTWALIPVYLAKYPFGAGIGSTGPATGSFGGPRHQANGESQFTFLIIEVGIPGLLLFIAFQARVLIGAVRRLRRLHDKETQILLAAITAPLVGLVVNWSFGINTTSSPNAPYLWFVTGILATWLFTRNWVPRPDHELHRN